MSGHSKWSTIKHKKAKEDAKRGKVFTKLIKEITVAARGGGGDPSGNPRLRLLLDKAKEVNMPNENATRAIKRGTGELPGVNYESYVYEGYGPGNTAVVIEMLTDNKNRAVAELRNLFSKKGGVLAEGGAVLWMFKKLGVIHIPADNMAEDDLLAILLDYDLQDITKEDNTFSITCDLKSLEQIKQLLNSKNIKVESAEVEWVPQNTVEVSKDVEDKAVEFLNAIEDLDDVQNVYTNMA